MKHHTDRRKHQRREHTRLNVKINVDPDTKGIFTSYYVTNLSKGGVFIETDKPHPIQSEISFTFILPELHTSIAGRGRVAWTYDIKKGAGKIIPGMGIKFTDFAPQYKALLMDYIEKLSSRPATP